MKSHSTLLALDLESVLVPEIWESIATRTGISELAFTTRDNPDYNMLMSRRNHLCRQFGLRIQDLNNFVTEIEPLKGAQEFLIWAKSQMPVIIVSDTFYELAGPLLEKLGNPTIACNTLLIDQQGFIQGFRRESSDGKRTVIRENKNRGLKVIAVGDSHNDIPMLAEADCGILFRPCQQLISYFKGMPVLQDFDQLRNQIGSYLEQNGRKSATLVTTNSNSL